MESHSFGIVLATRPKLRGNYAFPQKFSNQELSEITVFYSMKSNASDPKQMNRKNPKI